MRFQKHRDKPQRHTHKHAQSHILVVRPRNQKQHKQKNTEHDKHGKIRLANQQNSRNRKRYCRLDNRALDRLYFVTGIREFRADPSHKTELHDFRRLDAPNPTGSALHLATRDDCGQRKNSPENKDKSRSHFPERIIDSIEKPKHDSSRKNLMEVRLQIIFSGQVTRRCHRRRRRINDNNAKAH